MTKARDFLGPYRLTRLIRAGHSCLIWEAIHEQTKERYAIKMLKQEKAQDKEELTNLRHEYDVAKDLNHPNIIRVLQLETKLQPPFLVLELYSALNLKLVLRQGPEPLAHLADRILQQAMHALHYLHLKGWIHCDLKPDNMLVNDEGELKLIDFTIAQRARRGLLGLFGGKKSVRGTRSYMSPEQIRGEKLDGRADVYSLGCVMFELLTGRPPYTGSSPNELLEKHLKASVPSAIVYNNNVTRECADLIRRMMAKKRDIRPKSMWDVLQDFRTVRVFNKKPEPPKTKLSELDVGPVTDADSLKQLPQKRPDEEEE